jgi:hypothetical protein
MEDIGTKDDWAPAQRVFILSGVPKGLGVSNENSEELPGLLLPSYVWIRYAFTPLRIQRSD